MEIIQRLICLLLCCILVTGQLSVPVLAQSPEQLSEHQPEDTPVEQTEQETALSGQCGKKATWNLNTETGELHISGIGAMTNYSSSKTAPWYDWRESITTVTLDTGITTVSNSAFRGCTNLTSVSLPETVKTIGSYAFYKCSKLDNVLLPENLTALGAYAFENCSSLTSMVIPRGVTELKSAVFRACSNLSEILLPEGLTAIGGQAFYECRLLKDITLPETLETIGGSAFWFCSSFRNLVLPEGVKTIGDSAFRHCGGLETAVIPGTVEQLGSMVFMSCPGLSNVTLGEGLGKISDYMFYACDSLETVAIPESVTSIGVCAFKFCTSLEEISVPSAVTEIRMMAFEDCTALQTIELPAALITVGEKAFLNTALTDVHYNGAETEWENIDVEQGNDLLMDSLVHFQADQFSGHEVTEKRTEVSCTEDGGTVRFCTCGAEKKMDFVVAPGHTEVVDAATAPTCTMPGKTEGKHCSVCNEVLVAQETVEALGHVYTDGLDGTCNVCGIDRAEVEYRMPMHMFRMYNPNTGEHFYTGSEEERDNLIVEGWNYEGVGFTFSANTGLPVHRLFQPSTGEHLYTMNEAEKDKLIAEGWIYERVAFNSGYDTEAVQYRLHNPNAEVGAYHFTHSEEEKQNLLNLGWEDQGIGWYSCWK